MKPKVHQHQKNYARRAEAADLNTIQFGDNYPSGVYNLFVTQGATIKTLRIVKR